MKPTIRVIVSPQGEVRLETHGFTGQACRTASHAIEQALGAKKSESLTSDYFLAGEEFLAGRERANEQCDQQHG